MNYNTTTPYNPRYSNKNEEFVDIKYDLALSIFKEYLTEKSFQNSKAYDYLEEFETNKLEPETAVFTNYLQYLIDNEKISDDKQLYKELVDFMDYAEGNNLMHKVKKEHYEKFLNQELFKCNAEFDIINDINPYVELDYSTYEYNNFRKTYKNEVLNNIYSREGTIFLNNDAQVCLRLSSSSELKPYSNRQIEILLSSTLGYKIKITEDVTIYEDIDSNIVLLTEIIKGVSSDEKK